MGRQGLFNDAVGHLKALHYLPKNGVFILENHFTALLQVQAAGGFGQAGQLFGVVKMAFGYDEKLGGRRAFFGVIVGIAGHGNGPVAVNERRGVLGRDRICLLYTSPSPRD